MNEDIKPIIIQQAYIGSRGFVGRMKRREKANEEKKSLERHGEHKNVTRQKEEEDRKAEGILNQVAAHFQIDKELIQRARHGKGDLGKARTVLIYLLREFLPWTGMRIIGFAGLRSWGALSYHTTKEKIKSLRETIDILKDELKDI